MKMERWTYDIDSSGIIYSYQHVTTISIQVTEYASIANYLNQLI